MTVKQLSIFLENKSGTLVKTLSILKSVGIQLIATTVADTADYGIFRMICSEPQKAFEALKAEGFATSLCDVEAITLDDTPGKASDAIEAFAKKGVSISYFYSFLLEGKGILILKTA